VAAGSVFVEPVSVTREQLIPLKRKGARYVEKQGRLMVPLRYFKLEDETDLKLETLADFIEQL
jgi:hypothetical protein